MEYKVKKLQNSNISGIWDDNGEICSITFHKYETNYQHHISLSKSDIKKLKEFMEKD